MSQDDDDKEARLAAKFEKSLRPEHRMTPEQANSGKVAELYLLLNSDAYDCYFHDDTVSDPAAIDDLCRGMATLHMHAYAILRHPTLGNFDEQTRRLIRCVRGIRTALRTLEPIRKPGEESIIEYELPWLQACAAARAGGRLH